MAEERGLEFYAKKRVGTYFRLLLNFFHSFHFYETYWKNVNHSMLLNIKTNLFPTKQFLATQVLHSFRNHYLHFLKSSL